MMMLLSALLAALPRAFLAVLAPLVTERFMASVLRKVIVAGLRRLAAMTETQIDDQIVEDMARTINEESPPQSAGGGGGA